MITTLFGHLRTLIMGRMGLTSLSDSLTSFGVETSPSLGTCASRSTSTFVSTELQSLFTSAVPSSGDSGRAGPLWCVSFAAAASNFLFSRSRSFCSAAWYVRLRSRRKVSRKNTKGMMQSPVKMTRNQNVARQPNACVRMPPIMGPREGPRSGALPKRGQL